MNRERTDHVICGLPHRKRKGQKRDKFSGKQANGITEQFLQFLRSSAWLCNFWIYFDSNKEERESERKWKSLHLLTTKTISDISLISTWKLSLFFFDNNIVDAFHLLIYTFWFRYFFIWIIIIIISCRKHGYPWPSLATSRYHSSLLTGFQGTSCILT